MILRKQNPVCLPAAGLSVRQAAATARIGVAKADLFPRFSLTGSFGRRSNTFDGLGKGISLFWGAGPGIRWPVFAGGRLRANVRLQTARQEAALAQYEKMVLASLEDVENALVAYAKEKERQAALTEAVGANRRAVELAQTRYYSGLEDFLSVLDAQRQRLDSESQLVQCSGGSRFLRPGTCLLQSPRGRLGGLSADQSELRKAARVLAS